MADGDQLPPFKERGTVATTDATPANVATIAIPTGTEGGWFAKAWVHGNRYDASGGAAGATFAQGIILAGTVNAGSASAEGTSTPYGAHNPGSNAWTAVLDVSSDTLRLRVTGAGSTSIRWQGEVELHMREQAQAWGG